MSIIIKELRKDLGITQKEFADLFGLSLDTVKSWDCERRKPTKSQEKLIIEKLERMKGW